MAQLKRPNHFRNGWRFSGLRCYFLASWLKNAQVEDRSTTWGRPWKGSRSPSRHVTVTPCGFGLQRM